MEIEPIPYSAFQTLTSCTHALNDPDNHGCQWYATTDRRVAGRIYLDLVGEAFRYSLLHFVRTGWEIKEARERFENFSDVETALLEAMKRESVGREVTLKDVPPRARFGKGKTRGTVTDGEPI